MGSGQRPGAKGRVAVRVRAHALQQPGAHHDAPLLLNLLEHVAVLHLLHVENLRGVGPRAEGQRVSRAGELAQLQPLDLQSKAWADLERVDFARAKVLCLHDLAGQSKRR